MAGEVDAPSDGGDVGGSTRDEHQVRRSDRRVERGGVSARGGVDDRDARADRGASCHLEDGPQLAMWCAAENGGMTRNFVHCLAFAPSGPGHDGAGRVEVDQHGRESVSFGRDGQGHGEHRLARTGLANESDGEHRAGSRRGVELVRPRPRPPPMPRDQATVVPRPRARRYGTGGGSGTDPGVGVRSIAWWARWGDRGPMGHRRSSPQSSFQESSGGQPAIMGASAIFSY